MSLSFFRVQKYLFFIDYARKTYFFYKFSIFSFQFSVFPRTFETHLLGTCARKNKKNMFLFGFLLTYSYLCTRFSRKSTPCDGELTTKQY